MKKYILFFLSIVLILSIVFIYNAINVEENKKIIFKESGYVLNGTETRYYFSKDESYTKSYDDKIVFQDTEGTKITINNDNFLHYSNGNIVPLQDSVLLDLNKITNDPIIYYNVYENKEIKRVSNKYVVKNLDKDLQFEQGIWKISPTKYIILGENLKIILNSGIEKDVKDYIEIEYFDNEIVSIYNQEINYQTISSNSYIVLNNGIKLNLGTKIVSLNDVNTMSLEDMVINSDDNVTLIDLNEDSYNDDSEEEQENTTPEEVIEEEEENEQQVIRQNDSTQTNVENSNTTIIKTEDRKNTNSENNTNTNTTNNNTNTTNTTVGNSNTTNENEKNKITIETPEIVYDYVADNESKVDQTIALKEPEVKLENIELSSVGISGNIQINDEDDILSKEDDIIIKIINDNNGKEVYSTNEPYGIFNIPILVETLVPNTQYTMEVSGKYIVNENQYSKNFLYKTFVTLPLGLEIKKNYYTDSSLVYNLNFSDSLIESVVVSLTDEFGAELPNRAQVIKNNGGNNEVFFDGLNPDTSYKAIVSEIVYDGMPQVGENWKLEIEGKTLKEKAKINNLNYSINKRDGAFTFYIDDVTDLNSSIQSYRYEVYKFIESVNEEGQITYEYNTDEVVYSRETSNKEITIEVDDNNGLLRNQYYGYKVFATTYDNEKYVEIESNICGAFALNGITFPTVKFERVTSDYPPTEIQGWLYIIDNEDAITVDEDNPLTITYYSDVDEGELYTKRIRIESDERTTDKDGNNVIKIWVDLGEKGSSTKGLKSETSYTFSVYGTIDLKDGNPVYTNAYIGSCIVTTNDYNELKVSMVTEENSSNAFTVELSLDGDEVAKEGLSSIQLMLYEGSGDINVGEYENWSRTITSNNYGLCASNVKYDKKVDSLADLVFDNSLIITPSFIGGGKESNYTELNYQVLVTATIDGTKYSNKIPVEMVDDDDENTGNTYYIDKNTDETYTAAYIIVNGKGTTAEITDNSKELNIQAIKNEESSKYGLNKNESLYNNTIVGYSVGTNFKNTGSLLAKEVTYYVWNSKGEPILDEKGQQLTQTLKIQNQEKIPSAVFELKDGNGNDFDTSLRRGGAYFFSYTITYENESGTQLIWPISESTSEKVYTNQSFKTSTLYPDKQKPSFVSYPKTSDAQTVTYVYSCKDYDKALEYSENGINPIFNVQIGEEEVKYLSIEADGKTHEYIVDNLTAGNKFTVYYNRNLNPKKDPNFEAKTIVDQIFEGIVECNNIQVSDIVQKEEVEPNNIKVFLEGENLERVAAAQLEFSHNGKSIFTELIEISKDENNKYYINVNLLKLAENPEFINFINEDISAKVKIFYDTGIIGFERNTSNEYSTFMNPSQAYLTVDSSKNFVLKETISGNIYKSNIEKLESSTNINLNNLDSINGNNSQTQVELMYTSEGFKQNDNIVIQKEIAERVINEDNEITINIKNLKLGLKVENINASISSAEIKTKIINPLNLVIDKMYIQLWHSDNKNAQPNWDEAEIIEIPFSDFESFTLNNLSGANYYYFKVFYKTDTQDIYTYDSNTAIMGYVYKFETLTTIGITDLTVTYLPKTYIDKSLEISYNIQKNRSTMYQKLKYTFYDESGKNKIQLTNDNIKATNPNNSYEVIDGSLIVTNGSYPNGTQFEEVKEYINISPNNNVFDFGKSYKLEIIPYVVFENGSNYEIETVTTNFNLDKLSSPAIGLKLIRSQRKDEPYLRISISISDKDKIIYGQEDGQYEVRLYKYKGDIENAVEVDFYDKITGGNNSKGCIFNIKNNAKNYSLYVHTEDIDYSYNYYAELILNYDRENKGEEYLEEHKEIYTLKAINNEFEISIGSPLLVKSSKGIEARFYDTNHNMEKIDKIEYSVFNIANNFNQSGSFVPVWSLVDDEDGVTYSRMYLPIELEELDVVYTIKMNLYTDDVLIGQIDTAYINSK